MNDKELEAIVPAIWPGYMPVAITRELLTLVANVTGDTVKMTREQSTALGLGMQDRKCWVHSLLGRFTTAGGVRECYHAKSKANRGG